MKLQAAIYVPGTTTLNEPAVVETLPALQEAGFRCSLPGWLQRGELTIRAASEADADRRYRDHMDYRIAVFDTGIGIPVASGWIKEIVPDGRDVTYIFAGAWKEHDRQLEASSFLSQGASAIISSLLDRNVTYLSGDRTQIDSNTTQPDSVFAPTSGGQPVTELIEELLDVSDASGNLYDYWCAEQPMRFGRPRLHLPYYRARSSTADADWFLRPTDFAPGGLQVARHIWDYLDEIQAFVTSSETGTGGTTAAASPYGSREGRVTKVKLNTTSGGYLEEQLLDLYNSPAQQQAFTLTAPRVRAGDGRMVPLWDFVRHGPGYVRFFRGPELNLINASRDRAKTFFISAADYDYRSNTLRLVPELPDSRLDAILKRASGVPDAKGEMVFRGGDQNWEAPDPSLRGRMR